MTRTDPVQEAIHVLADVPYFAELEGDVLETLARTAVRRTYEADQIVFLEGEACIGLYVVQSGWLKAIKLSPEGREQILTFLGPGEDFNALSVFVGRPNPATVVTLEPTTLWLVPRETMLELLAEHPQLAQVIIQKLAGRVLHLLSLVEGLSLRSVEARVANFLLDEADDDIVLSPEVDDAERAGRSAGHGHRRAQSSAARPRRRTAHSRRAQSHRNPGSSRPGGQELGVSGQMSIDAGRTSTPSRSLVVLQGPQHLFRRDR